MADRPSASPTVYTFPLDVLTPPGTPSTAPLVTSVVLGDVWLEEVHLIVPSGPSGAMGVRVDYNGATLIPWSQGGAFLVLDGKEEAFEVLTEIDQHLQIVSYNTGYWPHTAYWRFRYIPMTTLARAVPNIVNLGA